MRNATRSHFQRTHACEVSINDPKFEGALVNVEKTESEWSAIASERKNKNLLQNSKKPRKRKRENKEKKSKQKKVRRGKEVVPRPSSPERGS